MELSSLEQRLQQFEAGIDSDLKLSQLEYRLVAVVDRVASCYPIPVSQPSKQFLFGIEYRDVAASIIMGLVGWLAVAHLLGQVLPIPTDKSDVLVPQPSASVVVRTLNSAPRTPHPELHTSYPLKKLFATARSPGSIAVGAAEGNLTPSGEINSIYYGHTDPGNAAHNEGFCSWNHADGISVAEADRRCLAALQSQSAAVIRNLKAVGIEPTVEVVTNGTDLWNQSNQAGAAFAQAYREVFDEVRVVNEDSLTAARVEAFRNAAKQLDASGLFHICSRYPFYLNQLKAYTSNSESWNWECIALDQRRRVREVSRALRLNVKARQTGFVRHPQDVVHLMRSAVVTVYAEEVGAGSIISASGLVLTCHHLVGSDRQIEIKTAAGQHLTGRVIANDLLNDLALIQLDVHKSLPTVRLAKVLSMKPGQKVYAIGSPYGHGGVITNGAFKRMTGSGDIQTTAGLLKPGNSGGPLLNAQGELIGVNKGLLDDDSGLATGVLTAKRFIQTSIAS